MSDLRQEKFIPLSAGTHPTQANGDLNVTVLRDSARTQSFQPLHQPAPPPPPVAPAAPANSPVPAAHQHEPEVILQREGDRVTGIKIKCGCGRVIELGCVYGPGKV